MLPPADPYDILANLELWHIGQKIIYYLHGRNGLHPNSYFNPQDTNKNTILINSHNFDNYYGSKLYIHL